MCYCEERSDEESPLFLAFFKERFLATLGMTMAEDFFRNLLGFLRCGGGDRPEKKALHVLASDRNMGDTYLLHSYGRFSNRKSD
jgi:hypothetical protein